MKIIMVNGVIGAGKDTYALRYASEHPEESVHIVKFGKGIVDMCAHICGIDLSDPYTYEQWKSDPQNRLLLQNVGEAAKIVIGEDVWSKKALEYIDRVPNRDNNTFIVTDFRYPVEFNTFYGRYPFVEVAFVDFRSSRYDNTNPHKSEMLAQYMVQRWVEDNTIIKGYRMGGIISEYIK